MAMWPQRVYTRKKPAGQRLNLTPKPDLGLPAKTEALPGLKEKGKEHCLQRITEKVEQSRWGRSSSGLPSTQLRVTGRKSPQENSTGEEIPDEKIAALSESVTDDFQVDSSSSNSELESGLSLPHNISNSLLSCSVTESYTEYKNVEENFSSFSSPELFRRSDSLDWECPSLEEHMQCKNSTLLDTSKAVMIEKASQFSNLSAILGTFPKAGCLDQMRIVPKFSPEGIYQLAFSEAKYESASLPISSPTEYYSICAILIGTSSENYQKCPREIVMTLTGENISPKQKHTSNSASDNVPCEVVHAENTCSSVPLKTMKNPEKDSEDKDINVQTKLSSTHLRIKIPLSQNRSAHGSHEGRPGTKALLPQPLEPALKTISGIPEKKIGGLLTSTPSSETADFAIDLSSVRKASFEELFPNVSNYVNSNEIVPESSFKENTSNKFPSNTSDICCIISASPGTRHMRNKGVIKKRYSPPKDIPQDIIMKTDGRI